MTMFATDQFVFYHLPKTAGIYVKAVCREELGMKIRFEKMHPSHRELPAEFEGLEKIGIMRDPWDWYASMYFFAKKDRNHASNVMVSLASDGYVLDFEQTLERLLFPDARFIAEYKSAMRSAGGKILDFECLRESSLDEMRERGVGPLGYLVQEIFPHEIARIWRYENLRKELFAFLSPMCADREKFRRAMVSQAKNVSEKPSLERIYTPRGVSMVELAEAGLLSSWGYGVPSYGNPVGQAGAARWGS